MGRNNLIVYGTEFSPPCQAVYLTLKALGITNYQLKSVQPRRAEHYSAFYTKINPAQSIPTLEDDGRFIGDSHAIVAYLVSRYGQEMPQLYPQDSYLRAKVDELLHFNNGTLQVSCLKPAVRPLLTGEADFIPDTVYATIEKAYKSLEGFFGDHTYLVCDQMTLADLCCLPTILVLYSLLPISDDKYPKLVAWMQLMKSLPYFEDILMNDKSMAVGKFIAKKLSKL